MSRPTSAKGRRQSAHRIRQKRQVRHAVASGGDMPPIGFVNRSPFFKATSGAPTDEKVYWTGPVGERAEPWKQEQQEYNGDETSASAPILAGTILTSGSSILSVDRSFSASGTSRTTSTIRTTRSTQSTKRRRNGNKQKRPKSASPAISVLSMLEFERKASNKSMRPSTPSSKSRRPFSSNPQQSSLLSGSSQFSDKLAESFAYVAIAENEGSRSGSATKRPRSSTKIKKLRPTSSLTASSSVASSLLSTTTGTSEIIEEEVQQVSSNISEVNQPQNALATRKTQRTKKKKKKKKKIQKGNTKVSNLEWATAFLGRVERRLVDDPALYQEFVDALRQGDGTLGSVRVVANAILSEHPDLMNELDNYIRRSMEESKEKKNRTTKRTQSARRSRSSGSVTLEQQLVRSTKNLSLRPRRRKKVKHWNWILDSAKTPNPTAMKKETLKRLQRQPKVIDPAEWKRPLSSYPTGRYKNRGINQVFSTAYPMTNLERIILDASRAPGPSEYQDPSKPRILPGGEFSTANPKNDVDWIIYRSKNIPGPSAYKPRSMRSGNGATKISDANPNNYLDWAIYYSKQTPGPSEYDISLCL